MARTIYEHLLRLTGDSSGLVRAADSSSGAIKRLDESSRRGQAALNKYNSSLQVSTRATSAFARAFGGITIGLVARGFVQAADSMTLLEGRLKLVTNGTEDLTSKQAELFAVSQDSRASLEGTTSFYVRLAQRLGDTSGQTLKLTEVTELVAKSLKIGGATAKETTSSLLQLSQALSSGLLRGDEFRSLSENAVGLMQNIADGAGVTQARLRELSIAGQLTTEFILDALNNSAPQIRAQFDSLPVTFGDAMQRVTNIALQGVNELNNSFDLTGKLVGTVETLTENADKLGIVLAGLVALKVAQSFGSFVDGAVASANAARAETLALENQNKSLVRNNLAKVGAANADVRALKVKSDLIKVQIAEAAQLSRSAATQGARTVAQNRVNALEAQAVTIKEASVRASGKLVVAETALAQSKRVLAGAADVSNKKLGVLGTTVGFLGGPAGFALLLASAAATFLAFRDGSDAIDLTSESMEQLNSELSSLNSLSFDELVVRQQQTEQEIQWRKELGFTSDALEQQIGIAEELNKKIKERIDLTDEGKVALRSEAEEALRAANAFLALKEAQLSDDIFVGGGATAARAELSAATEAQAKAQAELNVFLAEEEKLYLAAIAQGNTVFGNRAEQIDKTLASFDKQIDSIEALETELEELLLAQGEIEGSDERSIKLRKLVAERIKKIGDELNGTTKSTREHLSVTEQLEKKERELRQELVQLGAAHKATGQEVSQYSVAYDKAKKALDAHNGVVDETKTRVKELTKQYKDGIIGVDEFERQLKALGLTQEQINRITGETITVLDRLNEKLRDTNQALKDQVTEQRILLSQGPRAAALYKALAEAARELDVNIDDIPEKTRKIIEENLALGETVDELEAVNDAVKSFSEGLANAIVEGEDLGDFFENLWKRMVKDFLASGITRLIGSLVSGKGFDLSGFTTGGSGGSVLGGALGSIFGGGSSGGTSTDGTVNTGGFADSVGNALGLDSAQTADIVQGAAAVVSLYNGFNQIKNGNEVEGALNLANGGVGAFNSFQGLTGGTPLSGSVTGGLGLAGGILGLYNGIQNGDALEGLLGAYQTYQGLQGLGLFGGATTATGAGIASGFGTGVIAGPGTSIAQNAIASIYGTQVTSGAGIAAQTGGAATATGGAGGGGLAAGLGATAAGIGVGLLIDTYLNDSRVQKGFAAELEHTKDFVGNAFNGDFTDPVFSLAEGIGISLAETFGGRSTDELGFDQLTSVLESLEEGRAEAVDVGNGNTFLGGFNEDGVFFNNTLSNDQNDAVGRILQEQGLVDDARGIGDNVLRLEKDGLDFTQNSEEIIQKVKDAVAEVSLTITDEERTIIDSVRNTFDSIEGGSQRAFLAFDEAFDSIEDKSLTSSEKLAQAYSMAFDTTIEAANDWVASSELSAERYGQIFDNASGEALSSVLDFTSTGAEAVASFSEAANSGALNIQNSYTGLFNGIDLGNFINPDPIIVDVIQRNSQQVSSASNDNTSNQPSAFGQDLTQAVQELVVAVGESDKELKNIAPFIRQVAANPSIAI